jgi:hypothetical protein
LLFLVTTNAYVIICYATRYGQFRASSMTPAKRTSRCSRSSLSLASSHPLIASMEDPQFDLRNVVRSITEPRSAETLLSNVDRYFTEDAVIIHPMLNSPAAAGREGVKAAYKMLRGERRGGRSDAEASSPFAPA